MPRLLIVAYAYPPLATIGTERPLSLACEAKRQGWDVRVLTVTQDSSFTVDPHATSPVETVRAVNIPLSYFTRWLRFLLPGKETLWSFMDFQYSWVPSAILNGRRLFDSWPYDVLLSTAPPFSDLRVGASLASHFGLPSVADLRDPFINNMTRDFLHPYIRRFWHRYYYGLLSQFDERIVVDDCILPELLDLSSHLIRNGYKESEFKEPLPDRFDRPTIGFIGTVYKEYNLAPVFKAFEILPSEFRHDSRLLFVGKGSEIAQRRAQRFGVEVEAHPMVPRKKALEIMKRCHGLIYFGSEAVGTKIYEYPRTGALPIQIYDNESQHSYRFAKKHGLSVNVRSDNLEGIADAFVQAFERDSRDYPKEVENFTRRASAKQILGVLEGLLE